nr:DUF6544 family protein [Oscillochloris trichoides]
MKYLFIFVLGVHGLIHLMGFAKAFNLAAFEPIQTPISQPLGLLWLGAGLLLVVSVVLFFALPTWWWLPALLGVVLSQVLISTAWSDAKVGTLANLIICVPALVAALLAAPWNYRAQYGRDVAAGMASHTNQTEVVTEADLAHLPAAVQQYLRFAGVVGQPRVRNYQLQMHGGLRNGPNDGWMQVKIDQQSFVGPHERLFLVDTAMFGVPAQAYHRYIGPHAIFEVKIAALFRIVDARGPEMDRSETVTLFNDMCLLAPATLIDPQIVWEELDPQTVQATFTNAGNTIRAVLSFDANGALRNFYSDDRSRTTNGQSYKQVRWSTPVTSWRTVNGRPMPEAEARWHLPEGEFAYAYFVVDAVEYNVTQSASDTPSSSSRP